MDVNNSKEVKESIFLVETRREKDSSPTGQDVSSACSCKSAGSSGAEEDDILPEEERGPISFLGAAATTMTA